MPRHALRLLLALAATPAAIAQRMATGERCEVIGIVLHANEALQLRSLPRSCSCHFQLQNALLQCGIGGDVLCKLRF